MWQPAEGGEAISAAEAGYATLGENAPADGTPPPEGAPTTEAAEGMTSDGSPDSPDAGEQVAVAPEETAMHVETEAASPETQTEATQTVEES
jgi:hypothetical protein